MSDTGRLFLWSPKGSEEGYSIYYEEYGEGHKHVLLIHGLGGNCFSFRRMANYLAERGFHVWGLDLLGFGQSSKPLTAPYSFDLFAELTVDFLTRQKIASVHYVGHSMGGGIGMTLALKHAKKVKSLTLISSAGLPFKIPLVLLAPLRIMARLPESALRQVIKEALNWLAFDSNSVTEEMVEAYFDPLSRPPGPSIIFAVLKAFKNSTLTTLSQKVKKIRKPTLIIWGDNDPLIPKEHAHKLNQSIKSSQMHFIENCGHLLQAEQPHKMCELVYDFLKKPLCRIAK